MIALCSYWIMFGIALGLTLDSAGLKALGVAVSVVALITGMVREGSLILRIKKLEEQRKDG